jgi:hypothetical protein
MFILLLGAFFPNTLDGTIEGKPRAMVEMTVAFAEVLRNFLRETVGIASCS